MKGRDKKGGSKSEGNGRRQRRAPSPGACASVKGQALTLWLWPTDVSVRGQATGQQAAHAHTFVRMVTDRWKCRNNPHPPPPPPAQKPRSAVLFIGCV